MQGRLYRSFFVSGNGRYHRSEVITINTINPCKSPVSWVGNKAPILGIILALMPLGCDRFVDVFGGSGTVLLGKPPDKFEVYNDFDGDLVNLFRCMKERPLSVIRELGFLSFNSRDDFNVLKKFIGQEEFTDAYLSKQMELSEILLQPPEDDEIRKFMKGKAEAYDVRRACAYLKLLRYSYSSGKKSFASQPFDIRRLFDLIWRTHNRLSNVIIENQDFEQLIRHYDRPNTVFYCDPPYVESEYVYDKGFTLEDHKRLCHTLSTMQGKFLLSYNDCEWVRQKYKDFQIFDFSRVHSMVQRYDAGKQSPELLIGNFDLFERERTKPFQLTLFSDEEDFNHLKILKECILQCKVRL